METSDVSIISFRNPDSSLYPTYYIELLCRYPKLQYNTLEK